MKPLQKFIEQTQKLKANAESALKRIDDEDDQIRRKYLKWYEKSINDYNACVEGVMQHFYLKEIEILQERYRGKVQQVQRAYKERTEELELHNSEIVSSFQKQALKAIFETNEKTISKTISLLKNITEALKTLPHDIKDVVNELCVSILKENLDEDETFIKEYVSETSGSTLFKVLNKIQISEQLKASQKAVENFELLYKETTNKERIKQLKLFEL